MTTTIPTLRRTLAVALLVPSLAAAQRAAAPIGQVSLNPIAPFALSFYGDLEGRVAELQTLGAGIGWTNGPDRNSFFSFDAKYRFHLGDRLFAGWSLAPLIGVTRGVDDPCDTVGSSGAGCTGPTTRDTRLGFGLQVDNTRLVSRGKLAITWGFGAKRFVGGKDNGAVPDFLPTARLSVGVLF